MYIERYGICNCVLFSVVEICVDYDAGYVFHVLGCVLFMVHGFVLMGVV